MGRFQSALPTGSVITVICMAVVIDDQIKETPESPTYVWLNREVEAGLQFVDSGLTVAEALVL